MAEQLPRGLLADPMMAQSLTSLLATPALDRATLLPAGRRTFTDPGDDITEERSLEWAMPGLLYDPLMGAAKVSDMFAGVSPVDPGAMTQFMIDAPVVGGLLSAATGAAPKGAVLGANVFHGGPHRFAAEPDFPHGRPRLDKIGTGEGHQAYGYGFYSAEAPGVAKSYRDNLQKGKAEVFEDGQLVNEIDDRTLDDARDVALNLVEHVQRFRPHLSQDKIIDDALKQGQDFIDAYSDPQEADIRSGWKAGRDWLLKNKDRITSKQSGALYKLDIPDADVAKYLDYDKPLSEQSEHIQKAWAEFKKSELGVLADESLGGNISAGRANFSNPTGKDIYAAFVEGAAGKVGPEKFAEKADYKLASDVLRKAGIPGLKYFDADSRNRGRTATVDGTPIKQFNTEDYDLNNLLQKIEQGYSVGDVRKMAEGKRGLAAKFDALKIKINDGTRNYVTWDQDVLDRSKMLERDGVTLGANKAPTAALPGLLGKTSSELRAEANALRFPNENLNINAELAQSAKDYFGVTRSPNETGYIMQDGTRLDLSGRHYAGGYEKQGDRFVPKAGETDYLGGNRVVDHRELYDLKGIDDAGWSATEKLMRETGAVRYMPDTGFSIIDGQKVSDKQLKAIVSDFRKSGNPLTVDVDPVGGNSAPKSKTFDRPTVEGVRAFIELGANKSPTAALPGLLDDTASRMQRARDMGFDVDAYHGTDAAVTEFMPLAKGRSTKAKSAKKAYWFSDDPETASGYADAATDSKVQSLIDQSYAAERKGDFDSAEKLMADAETLEQGTSLRGQNIIPAKLRGKLKTVDMEGAKYDPDDISLSKILADAESEGFEGVAFKNFSDEAGYGRYNPTTHYAVFDPENIRSRFAKFDPAKADSADLLAANPATAALPSLLQDRSGNIDQRSLLSRTPRNRNSFPMYSLLGQRLYTATMPDGSI